MMLTRIIALGTLSALISAQTLDSLPQCGQLCVNDMLGKAKVLGCADNDKACLCRNIDFAYGIRDCSHEACGPEQAAPVVAYGMSYCSSVLNDVPPPGGNPPPNSSPAVPMPMPMPGNHTMTDMPSSSSMATSTPTGMNSAISTSTIISLITSGSEVQTSTVGFKTIYSSSIATPPPSSINSNHSPSSSSSPTSTPTSSDTSDDTQSSTSSAAGCKQTVFAGLAVAAGLAAMII